MYLAKFRLAREQRHDVNRKTNINSFIVTLTSTMPLEKFLYKFRVDF